MPNFPSKWYDFVNNKEIKRLRKDINNTFWLKMQICVSLLIAVLTVIFDKEINALEVKWKAALSIGICLIVSLVFSSQHIIKKIKLSIRNNVIINGQQATTLFDESIVYDVLVAYEFYDIYDKLKNESTISDELRDFYIIESQYYLTTAMFNIYSLNCSFPIILGEKKNQISPQRVLNLCGLISKLLEKPEINLNENLKKTYNDIENNLREKYSNKHILRK